MKQCFIFFLLTTLCISCSLSSSYYDISSFNFQPHALQDEEPVKLLFSGVGQENNHEAKYYNHLIVVSQKTGDTVNILTPLNNGLQENDGEKVFNYISPSNPMAKFGLASADDLQNITNPDDIKDKQVRYTKVIRHPKYDKIAQNNYPTVIGMIGTISQRE